MMANQTHGGTRKGAGRKPKPPGEKYRQYPLWLPPELIERLKPLDNRNGFIVEAIREKLKLLNSDYVL